MITFRNWIPEDKIHFEGEHEPYKGIVILRPYISIGCWDPLCDTLKLLLMGVE